MALTIRLAFCTAAGDFDETFNGEGPFRAENESIFGFENPGWQLLHPGISEFQDGGLRLDTGVIMGEPDAPLIWRSVDEGGNFFEKVQIRDYELDPGALLGGGLAALGFFHTLGDGSSVGLLLTKRHVDPFTLSLRSSGIRERHDVEVGPHIEFTIWFDASLSEVNFTYDNNLDDELPPLSFGPFAYTDAIEEIQRTELFVSTDQPPGRSTERR